MIKIKGKLQQILVDHLTGKLPCGYKHGVTKTENTSEETVCLSIQKLNLGEAAHKLAYANHLIFTCNQVAWRLVHLTIKKSDLI